MTGTLEDVAAPTADEAAVGRVVQRVVLPANQDVDLMPLYIDSLESDAHSVHPDDVLDRRQVRVRPGERLSFGSYFNAFPVSYWRRWTDVESVHLSVATEGSGTLIVYRSNAKGSRQRVDAFRLDGTTATHVDLPTTNFGDGGWYWFDLVAGPEGLLLTSGDWSVRDQAPRTGSVTATITSFNRPDYCVALLQDIADDRQLDLVLDRVLVVDQGTQLVTDAPGFEVVQQALGSRLTVIRQPNLGGSGGFARGMYEAMRREESTYVILLDDDITLEPEGLSRLSAFADYCSKPTIVGGHMFDMYNKSVLHAYGEVVNLWRIQPALPNDEMTLGHDFAEEGLRETRWLHRRVDVDYNGWWMCLIPTEVIRNVGLSLPLFIKWDDAEYGLRARDAGYPTVTLPGAAVWHVAWGDKDDLVGWQAYFHERNRAIVALMYSPYPRGGRFVRESSYMDVKHLISMQYYTEHGRLLALRDVLRGPDVLHPSLPARLGDIRAAASDYPDGRSTKRVTDFPPARRSKPPRRGKDFTQPNPLLLVPWTARTLVRHLAQAPTKTTTERPQVVIAHQDNKWWRTSQFDSAVVSNAEGTAVSWYQRNPGQFRSMLGEGLRLHAAILANWHGLRRQYRRAVPRLSSVEMWERSFGLRSPEG